MKRHVLMILYAAFCLAWAGVIACVLLRAELNEAQRYSMNLIFLYIEINT